jgi:anti-anti-sigma factor
MQRIAGLRPLKLLAAMKPESIRHTEESVIFVPKRRTVLNITIESERGVVTVRCQGRLVCGQESALFDAVVPHHKRNTIIIVDLNGVTAIDAAGIGALISLRAAGTHLRLVDPSEPVRQVLRLTNLHSVFDISESQCRKEARVPAPGDGQEFMLWPESA